MRAFVLLAGLLAQEPDIGALLKQLEDESIEVREKAGGALVELGEKAEERVKKHLESVEGELKARCEAILRSIQTRRRLAGVLPPLKLVTLDAKDAKLRDVLDDLQKQSGMAMQMDTLGDGTVTVAVKEVPPLEALNAVCKAAEMGWFIETPYGVKVRLAAPAPPGDPRPTRGPPSIRFQSGGYIDVPRFYARHYAVSPVNLQFNKWTDFRTAASSATLQLRLSWTPETRPESAWFEVKRVTDDKGRTLYEPVKGAMGGRIRGPLVGGGIHRAQTDVSVPLVFPEADAKAIGTVQGVATARFVLAEETVVFSDPEGTAATSKEYDGLTVELLECRTTGGNAIVKVAMKGRTRQAGAEAMQYQVNIPTRIKLKDGTTLQGGVMSMSGDGAMTKCELTFQRVTSEITAVEVVVDTSYHTDSFEFELKDIPLPK